jgi:hypothetical protein
VEGGQSVGLDVHAPVVVVDDGVDRALKGGASSREVAYRFPVNPDRHATRTNGPTSNGRHPDVLTEPLPDFGAST